MFVQQNIYNTFAKIININEIQSNMKRKILFLSAAILMSMASAFAQGGTTGPLTWTINNGTLTISGEGDMPDYEGAMPWYGFSIHTVVINDGVTRIGKNAFWAISSIKNVTIGNTVTSIGHCAFFQCTGLNSFTIPNSVTLIESGVFWNCSNLISVTIGYSVSSIEHWVFYDCKKLTSIKSYAVTAPICNHSAFQTLPKNISITIPCLSYFSYTNAIGWNEFTNYFIDGYPTQGTTYYTAKCYTPYIDENFTIPLNNPGIHYTSIPNSTGCDSILCLTLLEKPEPQLCMISVDDNNHNEIIWEKQEEVVSYNIYREEMQTGNYQLMANIAGDNPNIWVDMESNARIRSYRYKIAGVDTCEKESLLSLAHKTMHLVIYPGVGNSWNLIWTPYEGAHYSTYNIYRSSGESIGELELIGTMPAGGNTSYTDFSAPEGYVYYVVEIIFDSPCILDKNLFAIKSNIATNKALTIDKNVEAINFTLYPNPTTGKIHIENHEVLIQEVRIYDIFGRELLSCKSLSPNITVDISHLSAGVYFVKIYAENGEVIKKVLKK
jgi:hypothetical protein